MEKKRIYKSLVLPALAVLLVAGFLIWKLPGLRAERAEEPSAEPAAAEATEAPVTAPPEPEEDPAAAEQERLAEEERLAAEKAAAYREAEALLAAGDEQGAWKAFTALGDYADSQARADAVYESATAPERLVLAEVGDSVWYGALEQNGSMADGPEWIEWLALAREQDRILVISRYAIASQPFSVSNSATDWEHSDARAFLNRQFLNLAFSEEEQLRIPTVTVSADPNPLFDTDPGADTQDKLFLLSVVEADRYFDSDEARECLPTASSVAHGVYESVAYTLDGKPTCFWWLRQPGRNMKTAACIDDNGAIHASGYLNDEIEVGLRPVMWIDLS